MSFLFTRQEKGRVLHLKHIFLCHIRNSNHCFEFLAQHDTNLSQASRFRCWGEIERELRPVGTLGLRSQLSHKTDWRAPGKTSASVSFLQHKDISLDSRSASDRQYLVQVLPVTKHSYHAIKFSCSLWGTRVPKSQMMLIRGRTS